MGMERGVDPIDQRNRLHWVKGILGRQSRPRVWRDPWLQGEQGGRTGSW